MKKDKLYNPSVDKAFEDITKRCFRLHTQPEEVLYIKVGTHTTLAMTSDGRSSLYQAPGILLNFDDKMLRDLRDVLNKLII